MFDQVEDLAVRARTLVREKQFTRDHEKIQRMISQVADEVRERLLGFVELVVGIFAHIERPSFDANLLR
ncbi:MAG TPA: hypothetical protein VGA01_06325 [Candidatus Binatia bacterium]